MGDTLGGKSGRLMRMGNVLPLEYMRVAAEETGHADNSKLPIYDSVPRGAWDERTPDSILMANECLDQLTETQRVQLESRGFLLVEDLIGYDGPVIFSMIGSDVTVGDISDNFAQFALTLGQAISNYGSRMYGLDSTGLSEAVLRSRKVDASSRAAPNTDILTILDDAMKSVAVDRQTGPYANR